MAIAKDFLLNNDWDLITSNGDFLTGFSDSQHLALITVMDIGHLKENPFLGIGINSYLGGSESSTIIKANAQQMYQVDNYVVNSITVDKNTIINVDAVRL